MRDTVDEGTGGSAPDASWTARPNCITWPATRGQGAKPGVIPVQNPVQNSPEKRKAPPDGGTAANSLARPPRPQHDRNPTTEGLSCPSVRYPQGRRGSCRSLESRRPGRSLSAWPRRFFTAVVRRLQGAPSPWPSTTVRLAGSGNCTTRMPLAKKGGHRAVSGEHLEDFVPSLLVVTVVEGQGHSLGAGRQAMTDYGKRLAQRHEREVCITAARGGS